MKNKLKNNSGITLISVTLTIIVLIILGSITIREGTMMVEESNLQTTETNMLKIQAKVKAYIEEIESKVWNYKAEEKATKFQEELSKRGIIPSGNNTLEYSFDKEKQAFSQMGITDLDENEYKIELDQNYNISDIIYTPGNNYHGNHYTRLSEIKNLIENN